MCLSLVPPSVNVVRALCVILACASLFANRARSVRRVRAAPRKCATRFALVMATACRVRCALRARAWAAAEATAIVGSTRCAFLRSACVPRDTCQAPVAVSTSTNARTGHATRVPPVSMFQAHTNAHVPPALWATLTRRLDAPSPTNAPMTPSAMETKLVRGTAKVSSSVWRPAHRLCAAPTPAARWSTASQCASARPATSATPMTSPSAVSRETVSSTMTVLQTNCVISSAISVSVSTLFY